jgi:hypothetical protein
MEDIKEDFLSAEHELGIGNEIPGYWIDTSKWAKFVAVTFYVITGICILFFLSFGSDILNNFRVFRSYDSEASQMLVFAIITLIFVVAVVIVTFYFLLNFANKIRAGIESENIELVNGGLRSLKIHLIIVSIVSMLMLLLSLMGMAK